MEKYRITFRSEIYVEAESAEDAVEKFASIPIYDNGAMEDNGLDFCEVVSVEDEDGNDCI